MDNEVAKKILTDELFDKLEELQKVRREYITLVKSHGESGFLSERQVNCLICLATPDEEYWAKN